jgi:3-oxoacyl-(acyl-carrier-protein) synthase
MDKGMIIKMKYKLSYAEADRLIEKYYDGLTTGAEEKQLQLFLMRSDLPEKYQAEQAIFGYFDQKKERKHIRVTPYMRWAAVAAVALLVVAGPQLFVTAHTSNYAYIDGKKVSDIQEVRSHALASLGDISSSKDEVQESLKNINDTKLIEQQLDAFSK